MAAVRDAEIKPRKINAHIRRVACNKNCLVTYSDTVQYRMELRPVARFSRVVIDLTSRISEFSHRGFVGRDGDIVTVAAIFPSILVFS